MKALIVVEENFLTEHVGVRRVILFYRNLLEVKGYEVVFATPLFGRLISCLTSDVDRILTEAESTRFDFPVWTSEEKVLFTEPNASALDEMPILWRGPVIQVQDFEVSVISNPWLCKNGLPVHHYTIGIVYDMVPNLLMIGAINLQFYADCALFAAQHDSGYRFYLENCRNIIAISENTKADFERFYRPSKGFRSPDVFIPFAVPSNLRIKARPVPVGDRFRLLLVNTLDPRKNFYTVQRALELLENLGDIDIDVVGRERMPIDLVLKMFERASDAGANISWYRDASTFTLNSLYADADLLLFPSFYEGLGLPILEAQAHGVPVVCARHSSCVEINLNENLLVDDPRDAVGFAAKISRVILRDVEFTEGDTLRQKLVSRLSGLNDFTHL